MSQKAAKEQPPTAKAQIRWTAAAFAAYAWIMAIMVRLGFGASLSQAVPSGTAAAFSGLVGWTVYHLVSRRNDGILILLVALGGPHDKPFLLTLVISLAVNVTMAILLGLWHRRREAKEGIPGTLTAPLNDAEIDPPIL